MAKTILPLAAGLVLVILPFIAEGPGIFQHTAGHVYQDLTEDLAPHTLLLGLLLIVYCFYRKFSKN
jgi:hypothetical protein